MKKALYIALLLVSLAACTSKDPVVDPQPLMTREYHYESDLGQLF